MGMFGDKREEKKKVEPEVVEAAPTPAPLRTPKERPSLRLNLARGADGRLRKSEDTDIGDLWAEQERIRLRQAIEDDTRKAEKKKKRQQDGWLGLKKAKKSLPKALPKATITTVKPAIPKTPKAPLAPQSGTKEVVVSLSIPKIRLPKEYIARALAFVRDVPLPFKLSRKRLIIAGVVVVLFLFSFTLYPKSHDTADTQEGQAQTAAKDTTHPSIKKGVKPKYDTVLPKGKSIDDLGGWALVSPPNVEPVYAYTDKVGDISVIVSQQQLPKSFKAETATRIEEVAKQFTANDKITAGDTTAYIGTSIKGPQSVVFSKNDLLILIKSSAKVPNDQWVKYISSLKG